MRANLHLDVESLPRSILWEAPMSDDQFEALCSANEFFRLERTKDGEILVNAPAGAFTGNGNSEINRQLRNGWITHRIGRVFDSSTGFFLADGSMLNPDAAYMSPARLKGIGKIEMDRFLRRCPDFFIELLSRSDRLKDAKARMEWWIENGAALAWLIDPYQKRVFVYRPEAAPVIKSGASLRGSGPVEGFALDLKELWRCYEI